MKDIWIQRVLLCFTACIQIHSRLMEGSLLNVNEKEKPALRFSVGLSMIMLFSYTVCVQQTNIWSHIAPFF